MKPPTLLQTIKSKIKSLKSSRRDVSIFAHQLAAYQNMSWHQRLINNGQIDKIESNPYLDFPSWLPAAK